MDPNLLHLQSSFNRLKNAATPKKGPESSKKKTTPETKKKGSGEDVRIKIYFDHY